MKKLFIIANWKANKTEAEAKIWIEEFQKSFKDNPIVDEKNVILCPPFTTLSFLKQSIDQDRLPLILGSQDISFVEKGAYTGEIPAALSKEFISYSLVGHSERRKYFHETDDVIKQKVAVAQKEGIQVIVCVQDADTPLPEGVTIVAYEPITAIGTGNPDTPENANAIAKKIKETSSSIQYVLYGGSVNEKNVRDFTAQAHIDGVLVGSASLDPVIFSKIIQVS